MRLEETKSAQLDENSKPILIDAARTKQSKPCGKEHNTYLEFEKHLFWYILN